MRALLIGLCMLEACGPSAGEPTSTDRVCGVDGPALLLPADPGRNLSSPVLPIDSDGRELLVVSIGRQFRSWDNELWSVGPCGESPVLLGQELGFPGATEHWPGHVLARGLEGWIYVVDPGGNTPPWPWLQVGESFEGLVDLTPHGAVHLRHFETGPRVLELYPYPDTRDSIPAAPVILHDRVQRSDRDGVSNPLFTAAHVENDAVYVVDAADALVQIALPGGEETVVAEGVRSFDVGPRYIVWQALEITGDDGEQLQGPIFLRDRTTGDQVHLTDAALAYASGTGTSGWMKFRTVRWNQPGEAHVFDRLPTREHVTLRADEIVGAHVDQRRYVINPWRTADFRIEDFDTGERHTLFSGPGEQIDSDRDDGLLVHVVGTCCVEDDDMTDEGPIWFVPYAGERQLLVERATRWPFVIPDGRYLTRWDVDLAGHGTLVVVDPATQDHGVIADRVLDDGIVRQYGLDAARERDVLYWRDGEDRSGLWRARLAER